MATTTKTFEQYRDQMESNGYANFDKEEFLKQSDEVCYIPESADDLSDCYSYQDLKNEVEEWAEDNQEYFEENEITIEELTQNMFDNLEWTYPSTWLADLDY